MILGSPELYQFLLFVLVGCSSAFISFGIYSVLVFLGGHYVVSNAFAFVLSVLNSFLWNRNFVFKKNSNERRSELGTLLKTFIVYGFTGLLLQSFLLFLFIDCFSVSKYFSQILCIAINMPLNFLLNKFWAYKAERNSEDSI